MGGISSREVLADCSLDSLRFPYVLDGLMSEAGVSLTVAGSGGGLDVVRLKTALQLRGPGVMCARG